MKKNLLLIFVRYPELGKVKTRLAKSIGDEKALEIYQFLLKHTVSVTENLPMDKEVWYADVVPIPLNPPKGDDFWDPEIYSRKKQRGDDLGERMENAFAEGFKNGFEKIVIVGSDIYDLTSEDILTAFEKLENHDFVLGPAQDGGYYLLGMTRLETKLFRNKNWGSNMVLKETLADLHPKNLFLLEMRHDVDVYDDIKNIALFQRFLEL